MPSRILAMAAVTAAVVLSILGCGGEPTTFDPATRYTPGSLAEELSFRYKNRNARVASAAELPDGPAGKGGAVAKGADATKEAPDQSLDSILKDVIHKAGSIPGMTREAACKKVAEEVAKDPSIPEPDRKAIADRLARVAP